MNIVEERLSWRRLLDRGEKLYIPLLEEYRTDRLNPLWRASRQIENLLEYALYLEDKVKDT